VNGNIIIGHMVLCFCKKDDLEVRESTQSAIYINTVGVMIIHNKLLRLTLEAS